MPCQSSPKDTSSWQFSPTGYFKLLSSAFLLLFGLVESSWAGQDDIYRFMARKRLEVLVGLRDSEIGGIKSKLCIVNDVSASMGSSGTGPSIVDGVLAGKVSAETYNTGSVPPDCNSWSLLGTMLSEAYSKCCAGVGCHMLVVTDACVNHRNPFVAVEDEKKFKSMLSTLKSSGSCNLMCIDIEGTLAGGLNPNIGNYSEVPFDSYDNNGPDAPGPDEISEIVSEILDVAAGTGH